ncbi:hypothetical protein BDF22DRAFT_653231 [Syncephalis plumigaleata]|nr:hypothetical protein BDF22DRAFT_653231 [Syncephalis plumigaleata]
MHISINLINIAAVATAFTAVLLSMPVVNATPMKKIESIFKPVKETGVVDKLKGSLGKQDVDITCVKRSQPPHIVQQIYEHMAKDKITNGNTQPGRDHFADAPKMAEAEEMNCYITANTCVRGFRGTLGLMFFERDIQLSSKKIHLVAEQLSAVYAPEDDHLCFDANNKLLLTRYEDAVLLSAATRNNYYTPMQG